MAQVMNAPSAPTSIPKAKAFVGNVGDKALWIFAAVLAIGVVKIAMPYAARLPVVGRALGASNAAGAIDAFGTAMGGQ